MQICTIEGSKPSTSAVESSTEQICSIEESQPSISAVKTFDESVKKLQSRTTSFSPERKCRNLSPSVGRAREHYQHRIMGYRRKIKVLQQTKRRQGKKISTMRNIIIALKNKNFLLEENANVLQNISGPNKEILKRQVQKSSKRLPKSYNLELRKFALTLHYYSPRAYQYVRKSFDTCLPHPKTITSWYKSISGAPGFTEESFVAIKQMVKNSSEAVVCALLLDEVSIRQHLEFDGSKITGYEDMGSGLDGDDRPVAKDALVFMLVSINNFWKIPVGYFLVSGVSGEQRANLVLQCLTLAHDTGAKVVSLTFDGAPSNFTMASKLGCDLQSLDNLKTFFKHPVSSESVYIFPDPCHMIKLVRNTLGDKGIFIDDTGAVVSWNYLVMLHNLQENEGLHLGNKLRALHIRFSKQKMKVRLATQVFSTSVANALQFCREELKLPEFKDCEATIKAVQIFNNLFDIFNSKTMKQFSFKQPVNSCNYLQIFQYLDICKKYIANVKINRAGDLIIHSNRKIVFWGFIICIESLKGMYLEACQKTKLLTHIPLYRTSQDHLELFLL